MPAESESTPKIDLVEIEVESDTHTHEGKPCSRGTKIAVPPEVATWLKSEWGKTAK